MRNLYICTKNHVVVYPELKVCIVELGCHSALRRNLMKVWKTWTGPLLGGRAWSRGPKSALSKILQNKEHF